MTDSHLPPQDLVAEEALLGACMLSAKAIEDAIDAGVVAEMFLRPAHQHVWAAIMSLHEREQVDELTVHRLVKERGHDAAVGGFVGVSALVDRCPAVANARAYAVAVRDTATRRALVNAGHDIARLGYQEAEDVALLRDRAQEALEQGVRGLERQGARIGTMADQVVAFHELMQDRVAANGVIAGLSTGLEVLDDRWGGLQGGRLYVVAGRPGMGKTALGMGIAEAVCFGSGVPVLAFNFEMSPVEQGGRMIARHGSVNLHRIANAVPDERDQGAVADAVQRVYALAQSFYLDESPSLTVGELCRRARRHARMLRRQGESLGLIVVDYIQKIRYPSRMEQEQAVALASGELKALALELDVPVVALAQLNRGVEHRDGKIPSLADLRGSGAIEQDADVVALLFRQEYYDGADTKLEDRGRGQVITAKSRVGAVGVDDLRWEGEFVRYSDWTGPVFMAGMGSN